MDGRNFKYILVSRGRTPLWNGVWPRETTIQFAWIAVTRLTYHATHRSKHHARMGRVAQVSGVARLVGVQRAVQNNGNVNSEPKYLACEESPVRAFYC